MLNITVLVSGGGTNLQALIDAVQDGKITNGRINCVISSKSNAYALKRAENSGISGEVVEHKKCSSPYEFEEKIINICEKYNTNLIVLAGFMHILGENFIKKYSNKIINVHPSLIPAFCGKGFYGLKVHESALNYGVKISGATVHFVNEIPDGGAIILQKSVEIKNNDTPEILQKRIMQQAEWEILPKAVNLFCNDKIIIDGNKTYLR